ncbi:MAG: TerC family protein [Thermoleophilia bacterium]
MEPPLWAWIALIGAVPLLVAVDLLVFGRGKKEITVRTAGIWSICWIALGLGFAVIMAVTQGHREAGEYLSGYLIEWSLSIDNLFVFAVIFSYFAVPKEIQPKVLMIGVLGALVFRGIFIAIGAAALDAAEWVIYVFGAFLVVTAYRLARSTGDHVDPGQNKLLRLLRRVVPSTDAYHGDRIFIRRAGRRLATPVLGVLVVIASTDVIFAIDSIPAIFAVTDEAFIVLAANVFAVLGLRAMFFVIVGALDRFQYLNYGLAVVLALVGAKMLASDVYHPPVYITLGAVVVVLGVAVLASLWATRDRGGPEEEAIHRAPAARTPPGG